jgi:hypothetical protein
MSEPRTIQEGEQRLRPSPEIPSLTRGAFAALASQQLLLFVHAAFGTLHPGQRLERDWHVAAICHALQRVAEGSCRRLLVTVPPRHLKSVCAAVALPAWLLGRDPRRNIMVASYGEELARKHSTDFRKVIEAACYQSLFPRMQVTRNTSRPKREPRFPNQ